VTSERSSGCLEHETLVALIAGQLLLDQNPEVEEHLAECSECQNIVAAAAAGLAGSQDGPPSERENLPKAGDVVAGKYRIEKVLGRGGMGTVFAARHDDLDQTVAIKMLHSAAPTAAARFQREAKISAHLLSEHVARVFDLGTSDGVPFLVMEYLAGEDLSSVIARGSVKPELAVEYAQQICAALTEAHAAGIIHRDLKPSNVFAVQRTDGGCCLKILDFGVSKRLLAGKEEQSHDLTNAHAVLGSPAYMSPEQLRQSKGVDARTDIWSLGVLLYELLTTKRPFQAWSLAGLSAAIAADSPKPPSQLNPAVPAALDRVVLRCLSKEPGERFASAAEVAEALRRALPQIQKPVLRRRLIAATGLALASAAAFVYFAGDGPERTIAPVLPQPAPEPSPSRLIVHCDAPYPQGNFRFRAESGAQPALERAWPIVTLCADDKAPLRAQLAAALATPLPAVQVALDPPHPCYQAGVQSSGASGGDVSLNLQRRERCALQLTLLGSSCERVRSIDVSAEGIGRVRVSSEASEPAAANGGSRCLRRLEVPFEAYGKPLKVHLQPEAFSAPDVVFSGSELELPVRHTPLPRLPRRHGEPRKPCVPPEYCRN
jgi:serine/threonine-protein kinase